MAKAAMAILPALVLGQDPCKCLNWKQVYEPNTLWCGQALEYLEASGPALETTRSKYGVLGLESTGAHKDVCWQMFKKMDANYCLLTRPMPRGEPASDVTWCYVSKECKKLNGGRYLGNLDVPQSWPDWFNSFRQEAWMYTRGEFSYKYCDPLSGDKRLGDLPVEDLIQFAQRTGARLGSLAKWAYTGTWVFVWSDFLSLWGGLLDFTEAEVWKKVPTVVQEAVVKKEPIVFDGAVGGAGDVAILRGADVWELKFRGEEVCGPTQFCIEQDNATLPDNLKVEKGIGLPSIEMSRQMFAGLAASLFQAPTASEL